MTTKSKNSKNDPEDDPNHWTAQHRKLSVKKAMEKTDKYDKEIESYEKKINYFYYGT